MANDKSPKPAETPVVAEAQKELDGKDGNDGRTRPRA